VCYCSGSSYSVSGTFLLADTKDEREEVQRKGGLAPFYGVENMPIMVPTFSLPLSFLKFFFCVNDFHEKSFPLEKHICQVMSTPGSLFFLLGWEGILSCCWNADVGGGESQTQVGSQGTPAGALYPKVSFAGPGRGKKQCVIFAAV
jgi:hypothetical protein